VTKVALPSAAGVVAATGSALCCAGPVIAVALGVSGAGLSAFEPWRPHMLAATAFFLLIGFLLLDREERAACVPDKPCADAGSRRRMKLTLWVATILAVALASFPAWQTLTLN